MNLHPDEYKLIVEFSPNMIWRAGIDAKCDYFNQTWLNFTGKTMAHEVGDGWTENVCPDDLSHCLEVYLEAFKQQKPFEMEYRMKRADGYYRWINDRGVPIYSSEGKFAGYIGSCMDITEKKEGELLKEQAQIDTVSQVYNRNFMEMILQHEFNKAGLDGSDMEIILFDIDDFKLVNDQFGHLTGDEVLRRIAGILKANIREGDVCGRFGGDEFIIVVHEVNTLKAFEIAERIRKAIERHEIQIDVAETKRIKATVSCGISSKQGSKSVAEMIEVADEMLYAAKRAGKNCAKMVRPIAPI